MTTLERELATGDTHSSTDPGAVKPGLPGTEGSAAVAGNARYERGRELGRGGMGRVVEAVDRQFNRVVAIKELLNGSIDQRRFAIEAHVTGNLEHPGIPTVYEHGLDDRGLPFYAMRKVRGRTLAAILAESRTLAERLSLLPAVVKTAQALGYAHGHGVIHRDVKPENVIIGPYGDVVLLDWGIARVRALGTEPASDGAAAAITAAGATAHGAIIGTPAYMAPEQASGQTDAIDERTDVFALGALLYHLLTGRVPHSGTTMDEVLAQARAGTPRDVTLIEPKAPAPLVAIVARAMAKLPGDRYRSAAELAAALEDFQSRAVLANPPSRVIDAAVNVVIAFAVLFTLVAAMALVAILPVFFKFGLGAYFTVGAAVVGVFLSGLEWATRGRHVLSSLSFAFALTTLCAGLATVSIGLAGLFAMMSNVVDQPDEFRRLVARDGWEVVGSLTLAVMLAGIQFLLWGIASRRARQARALRVS